MRESKENRYGESHQDSNLGQLRYESYVSLNGISTDS